MYINENKFLLSIGEGIRIERNRSGLSQRELAEQAGVHKNFIGLIERGEKAPTVITLNRICNALGIGIGDFFQQLNL
uniref:helix-turn-helix domain-containing protein n=1 Tax=Paenibacillus sp. FSL k6-2145 TaxID=2976834 RepID=UPI00403F279E